MCNFFPYCSNSAITPQYKEHSIVQCHGKKREYIIHIYSYHDTRLQLLCDFEVAVHNEMTPKHTLFVHTRHIIIQRL